MRNFEGAKSDFESSKEGKSATGWESVEALADKFEDGSTQELVNRETSKEVHEKSLTPEQEKMKTDFAPEHLAKISDDEYIKLLQEVPAAFSTHVTRQGVRDHYGNDNHSEGMNQYHNGFLDILENGKRLQSALGASLMSEDPVSKMQDFLLLDRFGGSRDSVMRHHPYVSEENLWGAGQNAGFVDKATVHLATDTTLEEFYGAEEGNEIFFAFPGAMIASQYAFSPGYGKNSKNFYNDQWVYVDDQKGIDIDAGFTFIPKSTMVDRKTGSRYQLNEKMDPVIDTESQSLKLATDVVSAQEYWQDYFDKHPDLKPAHIVYYGEETPAEALDAWKEKNGITKPIVEEDFGFKDNDLYAPENKQRLAQGLEQVRGIVEEVVDDYYPKDSIEFVSDNISKGWREEVDEGTAAKIADNADLLDAIHASGAETYTELAPYLSAESLVKHADLLHAKGLEYDVNELIPQLEKDFVDRNMERLVANGCNVDRLFDRSLEADFQAKIAGLGDNVSAEDQERAFDDAVYGSVMTGQAAEYVAHGLNHEEIDKMIETYSGDKDELRVMEKAFEDSWGK